MEKRDNRDKVGISPILYLAAIAMILIAVLYACAGRRGQRSATPEVTPSPATPSLDMPGPDTPGAGVPGAGVPGAGVPALDEEAAAPDDEPTTVLDLSGGSLEVLRVGLGDVSQFT